MSARYWQIRRAVAATGTLAPGLVIPSPGQIAFFRRGVQEPSQGKPRLYAQLPQGDSTPLDSEALPRRSVQLDPGI